MEISNLVIEADPTFVANKSEEIKITIVQDEYDLNDDDFSQNPFVQVLGIEPPSRLPILVFTRKVLLEINFTEKISNVF